MTKPLTHRELNRATLARQMLLERSDDGIVDAVRFLGGLQAQQSNDPYIALWSRLKGFRHEDLTRLITERVLNRATSMRGTLHLHTADDLIGHPRARRARSSRRSGRATSCGASAATIPGRSSPPDESCSTRGR